MRKILILLGILLSVSLLTWAPLYATGEAEWFLVWADEFDYSGLPDPSKWSFATEGNAYGWGNQEEQYYTADRLENAEVANGYLTITARKEEYAPGFHYTSARIHTRGKGDWRYGRFECFAKLPGGVSIWPAFWMMPTESVYGSWPASGEIDIMEFFGFVPNHVQFSVNTKRYNHRNGRLKTQRIFNKTLNDEFHLYAVEWFPERLDFYLDEQKVFTFRKESDNPDIWPFDQRFHLILNNAVGGEYCRSVTGGVDDSIFPQEYVIDYVRVYQWNDGLPHQLSVTAGNGGNVEITPLKKKYAPGEQVTVKAIPDPGMKFAFWSDGLEGASPQLSFPLLQDTVAQANFICENELLTNGGFDCNLSAWNLWTDAPAVKIDRPSVEEGELRIKIRKIGKHDWQVQLNQALSLEEGHKYRLTFQAHADRRRPIRVSFNQDHDPYQSYLSRSFNLTTERQMYTMEMTMTSPTDPQSRIEFDLGGAKGTIWLDEISLQLVE